MEGFLLVSKPAGVTSFSCIGKIRHILGNKKAKVGHAGTLDKFANGLLVVGIGRGATRYLSTLLKLPKTYIGTGKLGELTDTYDLTGEIIETCDVSIIEQQLQNALASFGDGYMQTPPIFSALKYKGQRLSDLSRAQVQDVDLGEVIKSKQRQIFLYELALEKFDIPKFIIKANVSSGTYIRVLINDIAKKVDSCATTIDLQRTKIGPFELDNALDLEGLSLDELEQALINVEEMESILGDYSKPL